MHRQDFSDMWTIRDVGECLAAAMRHAALTAGPTAPAKIKAFDYSFGLPFTDGFPEASDEPARPTPPLYDPATVARLEEALTWQGTYVVDDPQAVEVLKVWLRAKTSPGLKFDALCEASGWSRSAAYRDLDRARGKIAQGLNAAGVPVWRP